MVNACCYVVRNGCSWRMLPRECSALGGMCIAPSDAGLQPAGSSRCMIGCGRCGAAARSARRSRRRRCWMRNRRAVRPQGGPSGYDAGKKVKGRKRNLVVDSVGLLLMVSVVPANVQDRDGADQVVQGRDREISGSGEAVYRCRLLLVRAPARIQQEHQLQVEVVRHHRPIATWAAWVSPDQGELVYRAGGQQGFRRAAETVDRGTHPRMVRTMPTLDPCIMIACSRCRKPGCGLLAHACSPVDSPPLDYVNTL